MIEASQGALNITKNVVLKNCPSCKMLAIHCKYEVHLQLMQTEYCSLSMTEFALFLSKTLVCSFSLLKTEKTAGFRSVSTTGLKVLLKIYFHEYFYSAYCVLRCT